MSMTINAVREIQQAIENLTADQMEELYAWLAEYRPQPFDKRIAADLHGGLLDKAIAHALNDAANGRTKPL